MKAAFLVLLCCWCIEHAQGLRPAPLESFTELLLAQHPTGGRGVSQRASKLPVMQMQNVPYLNEAPTPPPRRTNFDVQNLAGISAPLGFFDPLGFTKGASEGKIRFYREVELKHGRLAMLAFLGFLTHEQIHPMNPKVSLPSALMPSDPALGEAWQKILLFCAVCEIFSIFTFNSPFGMTPFGNELWSIRSDYEPGNLGFDPLSFRPKSSREYMEMKTRELNNGRLAMFAIIGLIGQELATGQKIFG